MPHQKQREEDAETAVCGEVARAVLASAGSRCSGNHVEAVVDQLESAAKSRTTNGRGLVVRRWESADDAIDDRDFIEVDIDDSALSGLMFLIFARNGFVPERMDWEPGDDSVTFNWKR